MDQAKWQMLITKEEIKRVPEDEGVNALIQLIKDDGKWIDP